MQKQLVMNLPNWPAMAENKKGLVLILNFYVTSMNPADSLYRSFVLVEHVPCFLEIMEQRCSSTKFQFLQQFSE